MSSRSRSAVKQSSPKVGASLAPAAPACRSAVSRCQSECRCPAVRRPSPESVLQPFVQARARAAAGGKSVREFTNFHPTTAPGSRVYSTKGGGPASGRQRSTSHARCIRPKPLAYSQRTSFPSRPRGAASRPSAGALNRGRSATTGAGRLPRRPARRARTAGGSRETTPGPKLGPAVTALAGATAGD